MSVGLALAGELRAAGMLRNRILLTISGLGSLVFITAVAGATVLSRLADGTMEIVLSFGAAALLYLVTEELLREAHEERESATGTAMFFIGFLTFLVIGWSSIDDQRARAHRSWSLPGTARECQDRCRMTRHATRAGVATSSRSGFKRTALIGSQLRTVPLHRSGVRLRARR